MWNASILTLYPELFPGPLDASVLSARASLTPSSAQTAKPRKEHPGRRRQRNLRNFKNNIVKGEASFVKISADKLQFIDREC